MISNIMCQHQFYPCLAWISRVQFAFYGQPCSATYLKETLLVTGQVSEDLDSLESHCSRGSRLDPHRPKQATHPADMAPQRQRGIFVTSLDADKAKAFDNLEIRQTDVPQPKNGQVRLCSGVGMPDPAARKRPD